MNRSGIKSRAARGRYVFATLALCGIAVSHGVELFVNGILRPDARETTWISEAVLTVGFVAIIWLWMRLRETEIALTDLERQQIVTETQLTIAARVQASLLPAVPRPSAGIGWYAVVEPAGKVGGDYYDFIPLPGGRMCVVLGDVSGKGVGAAVFVANVRATLRALARGATHPGALLSKLSSVLLEDSRSDLYLTCIVAIVDPGARSMVYVNAGHPTGVLWSPHDVRGLGIGGPPAGLLRDAAFEEERVTFGDGDLVVLVSDGVTEALNASGDEVVGAIAAQVAHTQRRTPEAVCRRLLAAASTGSGPSGVEGWMDDRTAVVFGVIA